MSPTEFKSLVKKIVREEVKTIVQEEINKTMAVMLAEVVRNAPLATPPTTETSSNSSRVFSKNPAINSALNETAKNPQSTRKFNRNSLIEMMGGFDKIKDQSAEHITESTPLDNTPKTNIDYIKSIVSEGTTASPVVASVLDTPEAVPDILKKVFNRDFRPLMKAIKKRDEA